MWRVEVGEWIVEDFGGGGGSGWIGAVAYCRNLSGRGIGSLRKIGSDARRFWVRKTEPWSFCRLVSKSSERRTKNWTWVSFLELILVNGRVQLPHRYSRDC